MKNCSFFLSLALMACSMPASLIADNITVNGQNREYKKYIPDDLGKNRPLLVSMHGMNQDAEYQRGMLQIESIADTAKFATVFPEGINRAWDISGTSDIDFVLAVIDDMAEKYDIDKNRVYLSGFSMGGMFTYHAMNHIADCIAAFAPISGYPMWGQPFESLRPVPIIHTHGTADDVVTYDNVQARLDGWIERNGCSATPMITENYRYNGCKRYQWGPGDEGAEIVLIERADKGHWIANDWFYTGEEIWNFCKRYSLSDRLPAVDMSALADDKTYNIMGKGEKLNSLSVQAEAQSEDAEIVSVAFYVNGEFVSEDKEAPYECTINGLDHGSHFIKAVATDSRGTSIARMKSLKVNNRRKSFTISSDFKNGLIPNGWITSDARVVHYGPMADLTAGPRVIEFTGDPKALKSAFYLVNITGAEDKGWISFGDNESSAALYLPASSYTLSFDACNWNMPEFGEIRCYVLNANTDALIAHGAVTPNTNLDKSAATPFAEATNCTLSFDVKDEPIFIKIIFYAENAKKADGLIGNIKLTKEDLGSQADVAVSAEPMKVEYYDLLGRRAIPGQKRVLIQRTYYRDGSVEAKKIISRTE